MTSLAPNNQKQKIEFNYESLVPAFKRYAKRHKGVSELDDFISEMWLALLAEGNAWLLDQAPCYVAKWASSRAQKHARRESKHQAHLELAPSLPATPTTRFGAGDMFVYIERVTGLDRHEIASRYNSFENWQRNFVVALCEGCSRQEIQHRYGISRWRVKKWLGASSS